MLIYKDAKISIDATSDEVIGMLMDESYKLKYKYPNIGLLPVDESKAILTGLIFKVIDNITLDPMDLVNISSTKINDIASRIGTGLSLALLERNVVDVDFVQNLTSEVMKTKLLLAIGKMSVFGLTRKPYTPDSILTDEDLYYKYIIETYNKF